MGNPYADGYKDGARDTKKVFEDSTLQQKTISDLMDERDTLQGSVKELQAEVGKLARERDEAVDLLKEAVEGYNGCLKDDGEGGYLDNSELADFVWDWIEKVKTLLT